MGEREKFDRREEEDDDELLEFIALIFIIVIPIIIFFGCCIYVYKRKKLAFEKKKFLMNNEMNARQTRQTDDQPETITHPPIYAVPLETNYSFIPPNSQSISTSDNSENLTVNADLTSASNNDATQNLDHDEINDPNLPTYDQVLRKTPVNYLTA